VNTISTLAKDLFDTASKHLEQGDLPRARQACQELLDKFPNIPTAWSLACSIALAMGDGVSALSYIGRALDLLPDNNLLLFQKARCFLLLNQYDKSKEVAYRIAGLTEGRADLIANLGQLFSSLGDYEKAITLLERAVELAPEQSLYHSNLANVQRMLGLLTKSELSYDRALKLNPENEEPWSLRSSLRTQTIHCNHVKQLETYLRAPPGSWRATVHIYYALAKEYEDLEKYEESFGYLQEGALLYRQKMGAYSVSQDITIINDTINAFDKQRMLQEEESCNNAAPIFIVGLPRSGTTLVERIIGSHSDVFAAGELSNLSTVIVKQVELLAGSQLQPKNLIEKSAKLKIKALGQAYIDSTNTITNNSPHFTDKLPMNYLHCGLINLALPQAKIIHVTRDPMDSCYSMFKQLFDDAYKYSYDLNELAQYYINYHKLMEHWRRVLPGGLFEVAYEDLVADQISQTRRLLDYCELTWQQSCVNFHLNREASTTASAAQIRQPIYSGSVGKWKLYRKQLAPLLLSLQTAGLV